MAERSPSSAWGEELEGGVLQLERNLEALGLGLDVAHVHAALAVEQHRLALARVEHADVHLDLVRDKGLNDECVEEAVDALDGHGLVGALLDPRHGLLSG